MRTMTVMSSTKKLRIITGIIVMTKRMRIARVVRKTWLIHYVGVVYICTTYWAVVLC